MTINFIVRDDYMFNKYGLNDKEVIENRKKYGTNNITNNKKESLFHIFLETLGDPIIKILLIVLGIKIIFLIKDFDWYETIGIVIAILLASLISTISEYGSQKAFLKLTEESSKIKCRVRRNNKIEEISFDKNFSQVMNEILHETPVWWKFVQRNENSDYVNITGNSKNCYMCFASYDLNECF